MEGKISAGLGSLEQAEATFVEVREMAEEVLDTFEELRVKLEAQRAVRFLESAAARRWRLRCWCGR